MTFPARQASLSVRIDEPSAVGEARRCAVKLAAALQLSELDIGHVALMATEAATNILQHAERGEILLRAVSRELPASLEILALDKGPGMANVAEALRDGFSTGGSAGLGLGAIARLATHFEVSSTPGKGTALLARIGAVAQRGAAEPGLEWGVVCMPKRDEEMCGDAWSVNSSPGRNAVLIIDGLGHGPLAFDAANEGLVTFLEHAAESPKAILNVLHGELVGTRGAVAAVAEIDWPQRELRYAGAGNIAGALVSIDGKSSSLVSRSGTLGHSVARVQEFIHRWPNEGVLVMHSDGLSSHWDLAPYPGLIRKDPSLIAGVLYRDFANRRDDVVVFVGREYERSTREQDRVSI